MLGIFPNFWRLVLIVVMGRTCGDLLESFSWGGRRVRIGARAFGFAMKPGYAVAAPAGLPRIIS